MRDLVYRLPNVGKRLTPVKVIAWLVGVGDPVRTDQPVVWLDTSESQLELPAPADGTVVCLVVEVGDLVSVGGPLFILDPTPPSTDHPISPSDDTATLSSATAAAHKPRRR